MIKLKNINKQYAQKTALKNINLNIQEGEFVILKGVSGSGKTTILSLIAALLKPTSGEVVVNGLQIARMTDHFAANFRRENIGFVFQKYNLIAGMSAMQNILLPLVPLDLPSVQLEQKAQELLHLYGLEEYAHTDVARLSGGQQQRVAIARAVVNDPKIILADEPTSNLDEALSLEFIKQMQELKSLKKTIIIATHDPRFFTLDCVDRIVNISDGQIVS